MLLETKTPTQCTNCQRLVPAGEIVNAADQAALNNRGAICLICIPAPVVIKAAKKAAE